MLERNSAIFFDVLFTLIRDTIYLLYTVTITNLPNYSDLLSVLCFDGFLFCQS